MNRRTKAEIARDLRSQWRIWKQNGYAQFGTCPRCLSTSFLVGPTHSRLRCESCHLGKYVDS